MEEFINQTLGGVSRQIEVATIAAMKAIGFTNSDVRKQYLYKMVMVSIAGIFVGILISNILGESIASGALSMMGLGISKITFIINRLETFVILLLLLLAVAAGMTWISTRQIREYNIISLINE